MASLLGNGKYSSVALDRCRRRDCAWIAAAVEESISPDNFSLLCRDDCGRDSDVVDGATKRSVCFRGGGGGSKSLVMEMTLAAPRLSSRVRLCGRVAGSGRPASSGDVAHNAPWLVAPVVVVRVVVTVPPILLVEVVIVVPFVLLLRSACNLASDLAMRRSCTRLRTFRSVSMGPRRDCDLPLIDPDSESDSQTDCSP